MHHRTSDRSLPNSAALALALLIAAGLGLHARGADPSPEKPAEPSKLAKDLIGTWVLVGTPDKIADAPKSGGRLKFFTGKNWCITQADPDTGAVIFHHGGTYALSGDSYTETIDYATESTAFLIKKTFKFKIKIDGDTYTQTAVSPDNSFTEVWKRAK